jgi:Uma2 family endonuclease
VSNHCTENNLGSVATSLTQFQCFPRDPNIVRKPDLSFIRRGRLPREQLYEGYVRIAPDVAGEVVSPNELAYEVERKVQEYLDAGVLLVWVVYPETRMVFVHRQNGSVQKLRENEELTGEDVIPGFRCLSRYAKVFSQGHGGC